MRKILALLLTVCLMIVSLAVLPLAEAGMEEGPEAFDEYAADEGVAYDGDGYVDGYAIEGEAASGEYTDGLDIEYVEQYTYDNGEYTEDTYTEDVPYTEEQSEGYSEEHTEEYPEENNEDAFAGQNPLEVMAAAEGELVVGGEGEGEGTPSEPPKFAIQIMKVDAEEYAEYQKPKEDQESEGQEGEDQEEEGQVGEGQDGEGQDGESETQKKQLKGLAGAYLQLEDAEGNQVDRWTSDENPHEIQDLAEGTYTLREISAPKGYTLADDITLTLSAEGELTSSGETVDLAEGGKLALSVGKKTSVKILKIYGATGDPLADASMQILDKDGTVVQEWTTSGEPYEATGLATGEEYTLKEAKAPEGFEPAEDVTFSLDTKGVLVTEAETQEDEDGNKVIVVKNEPKVVTADIYVSKRDAGSGSLLPGASLHIFDGQGELVKEWTSSTEATKIEGLAVGTYTLHESVAPDGYELAENSEFTVDEAGEVTATCKTEEKDGLVELIIEDEISLPDPAVITPKPDPVIDPKPEVTFSYKKTNAATGEGLANATIALCEVGADGSLSEVDKWVSEAGKAHAVGSKMVVGTPYVIQEVEAPRGFGRITKDISVTASADGTIETSLEADSNGVYLIPDSPISFLIMKVAGDTGEGLDGGTFAMYEITGDNKIVADSDGKALVIHDWTSKKDEAHDFGPYMESGKSYLLVERAAPTGYNRAANMIIKVSDDGAIETDLSTMKQDGFTIYLIKNDKRSTESTLVRRVLTARPAASTAVSSKSTSSSATTTPKATTTSKSAAAKTGDDSPIALYVVLLIAAAAVVFVVLKKRKKQ
ncbi:MAG: SpaA isopeptide-forming pilin-related protein [Lachnospiraceae bacterium]|nr:SpaA isopeptide-forming pilin-related protein [Lachnospiraceae bacterium]